MQKKLFKKFIFALFLFINFNYSIFLFSQNIENSFFWESTKLIQEIDNQVNKDLDKEVKYFEDIKVLKNKILAQKIDLNSMTYSNLMQLFIQIKDISKGLSRCDDSCINDLKFKNMQNILSLLEKGMFFELSKLHLNLLNNFLLKNLETVVQLIDYWKLKFSNKDLQGKIESIFKNKKKEIKIKLKNLFYFKERFSVYLGKVDELISCYQDISSDSKNKNVDIAFLDNLTIETIYCINSFFIESFVPGAELYNSNFLDLNKSFSELGFKKFMANHMNVLLLEDSSAYLLRDYKTPGFLRRNWLKISSLSLVGTLSGFYIYKNWQNISTSYKSIKDDSVKSLSNTYSSFIDMVNKKLGLNISGGEDNLDDKVHLGQNLANNLRNVRLEHEGLTEEVEANLQGLKVAMDAFNNSARTILSEQDFNGNSDIGSLLEKQEELRNRLDSSVENIADSVKDLAGRIDSFSDVTNDTTANLGIGKVIRDFSEQVNQESSGDQGFLVRIRENLLSSSIGEQRFKVIEQVLLKIDSIIRSFDTASENGALTDTRESFFAVIKGFDKTLALASENGQEINHYLKIYEGLVYGIVGLALDTACKFILSLVGKGDMLINKFNHTANGLIQDFTTDFSEFMGQISNMANDINVTANWVKVSIPVIVTSVIIPLGIIFSIKKLFQNKRLRLQNKVNSMIIDIYRILNLNNSLEKDIWIKNLPYKDRGLFKFFVHRLEVKLPQFLKTDKSKILELINDIKHPNFTIGQKIDFIKAGWAYNLFPEK